MSAFNRMIFFDPLWLRLGEDEAGRHEERPKSPPGTCVLAELLEEPANELEKIKKMYRESFTKACQNAPPRRARLFTIIEETEQDGLQRAY